MNERIGQLVSEITQLNRLQSSFLASSMEGLNEDELLSLDAYLAFLGSLGMEIAYIARCYDLIVKDTLTEQMYFMKHAKYRCSSYKEVMERVYLNPEYMRMYMYGLGITIFLWPSHRQISRFFRESIPRSESGTYLEIGPGHGYYFMNAMKLCNYDFYEGVDLSPTSAEMTRSILSSGYFGSFRNYEIRVQDFMSTDDNKKYDAIVMGEVLEHVEQPLGFLKKIRAIASGDPFIYITTNINAPAIDHIALFRSITELRNLFREAELQVKKELAIPYSNLSLEESMQELLPVNVAYVLGV